MIPNRSSVEELLEGNREWADRVNREDPEFFDRLAKGQAPPFLYIGCADSRVPPDHFTNCRPGSLFVTRNVANQIRLDDLAMKSVVSYAVSVLKVKHVIVCGHTGCGGVIAAMGDKQPEGHLGRWIAPLAGLVKDSEPALDGLEGAERVNKMVELNVEIQARKLTEFTPLREAWSKGHAVDIHGWVFDLTNGRVRQVARLTAEDAAPTSVFG